jgi:DeoR/GlpR family transcriptional regulator of sugar metabolism
MADNRSSQQRRDTILTEIFGKRHVAVKDLAARLAISEATVRRDLKVLADTGQVELRYGGATLARADYSFRSKGLRNIEGKRIVARLAAELISDHDQVFLDSGTTCFELAQHLKRKRDLLVIVNSARLALELDTPGLNVIMLGGQYRPERMDTVGPLAISALDQLRGYAAFIGADGLSQDFGLTASDIESASLYRGAVRNARETIVLVDSSKFLSPSLFKIVDWYAVSRLVTDKEPPPAWLEFLAAKKVTVLYPSADAVITPPPNPLPQGEVGPQAPNPLPHGEGGQQPDIAQGI